MFIAPLFTITKVWKHSKIPLTDEWIKNVLYAYSGMLFNLKNKTKEISSLVTIWMNLEDIMLSEISQTQTNTA